MNAVKIKIVTLVLSHVDEMLTLRNAVDLSEEIFLLLPDDAAPKRGRPRKSPVPEAVREQSSPTVAPTPNVAASAPEIPKDETADQRQSRTAAAPEIEDDVPKPFDLTGDAFAKACCAKIEELDPTMTEAGVQLAWKQILLHSNIAFGKRAGRMVLWEAILEHRVNTESGKITPSAA